MRKTEVRQIAESHGFVNAKKHDSQDICFVQSGTYADFIRQHTGKIYPPGNFILKNGTVLGTHKGIINYTVGQRKGLGISYDEPLYVMEINAHDNTVILGTDSDLYSKTLTANNINLISVSKIEKPARIKAKVRYRQTEQPATVIQTGDDSITVEFDEPQRAITKGQAVVLYDGDTVLGGWNYTITKCVEEWIFLQIVSQLVCIVQIDKSSFYLRRFHTCALLAFINYFECD